MTSNNNSRENIQESPLNDINDINDYDTAFNAFQEGIYNTINEFLTEGTNPDQKWDIGDVCDAVFSGDGLRYMAHIKTINKQEGSCVIEFVHYSITENVLLSSLTPVSDYSLSPSKPKSSNVSNRNSETNPLNNEFVGEYFSENKEFLSSCGEAASFNCDLDPALMLSERDPKTGQQRVGLVMDLDDSASGERVRTTFAPPSGLVTDEATPTLSQSSNYSNYCNMSSVSNQRIPVPLAPTCLSGATIDNVFASTLQSWYISGYHTGYYVAMRQLQKFRDECNGFSSSSGTATPLSSDLNLPKMINKKDTKAAQQMDLDDSASGEKVSSTLAPSLSPMSVEAAPTLNQSSNMSGFSNQLISIPPEPPCLNGSTIDDAFAFTLNSWYMSGYHTGYYQAIKQFQR